MKCNLKCSLSLSWDSCHRWREVKVIFTFQVVLSRKEIAVNIFETEFKSEWNKTLISTECSKCKCSDSFHQSWNDLVNLVFNYIVSSSLRLNKATRNMELSPFAFRLCAHQQTAHYTFCVWHLVRKTKLHFSE